MKTIYILGETKIKMVVCLQNRGLVDKQIYILCFVQRSVLVDSSLHKKWSFSLGIFWVNMTKLAVSWKFGYTYLMGNFIFLQWLSQYTITAKCFYFWLMFKVRNRNTKKRCDICSKLTIKTPERRQQRQRNFVYWGWIS